MRMATCDHCGEEAPVNHSDGSYLTLGIGGEFCAECWDELRLPHDPARQGGHCKRPLPADVVAAGIRDNITRAREEDR